MSTIVVDNPSITSKYTTKELQMKFLNFLESELKEDSVSLYEIEVQDLSENSRERYRNRDSLKYTDY